VTNGPFKIALLAVKNQDFYADLKILNLPWWQNTSKKFNFKMYTCAKFLTLKTFF
jgi:hypothetical protein